MGSERLTSFAALAALALHVSACGGANVARPAPVAPEVKRHAQIFHAMKTPARRALVERFRERNPAPPGARWTVNDEALVRSLTVVDPFAGFLRRARRTPFERLPRAQIDPNEAIAAARDFVKRNADLLGLPRHVVPGLAEHVRPVEPSDHPQPRALWAVRLDAPFANKGYEAFDEISNVADVEVIVDDDGEVSEVVNVSRIHPHLALDTRPELTQEDPRTVAKIVGRRLFALDAADADGALDLSSLRGVRRIELGTARPEDVEHVQLVIHVATGPELAWMTYRLAYFVQLVKAAPPGVEPITQAPLAVGPTLFAFRYVVDADTGEVLEDARVPLAAPP